MSPLDYSTETLLSMTHEGALRHPHLPKVKEKKIKSPSLFVASTSFVHNTPESLLGFLLSLQVRLQNSTCSPSIRLTHTHKLLIANSDNDQAPVQHSHNTCIQQFFFLNITEITVRGSDSAKSLLFTDCSFCEGKPYELGIFKYHWVVDVKVAT